MILAALNQCADGPIAKSFVKCLKNCRSACRAWSRQLALIAVRVNDTKVLINALDLLEEQRLLHDAEAALRRRAIQGLQDLNSE